MVRYWNGDLNNEQNVSYLNVSVIRVSVILILTGPIAIPGSRLNIFVRFEVTLDSENAS